MGFIIYLIIYLDTFPNYALQRPTSLRKTQHAEAHPMQMPLEMQTDKPPITVPNISSNNDLKNPPMSLTYFTSPIHIYSAPIILLGKKAHTVPTIARIEQTNIKK